MSYDEDKPGLTGAYPLLCSFENFCYFSVISTNGFLVSAAFYYFFYHLLILANLCQFLPIFRYSSWTDIHVEEFE